MSVKVNEQGFVHDPSGVWYPPINLKQLEIFDDHHRYLLVHGPRKSGKTIGILHKVLRHAFDVNGAMVAIVCKTIKNAKSSGVWTLLTNLILPTWERDCYGFSIVEGPKTTGDTKLSFVKIRNRHGTVSEIQCHSLEYSAEVEAKFKGGAYSMFWLSELDQYCDEYAFHIICDAMRVFAYEVCQIICDCNPPDSGPNNWIHDLFFKFKDKTQQPEDPSEDEFFRNGIGRIWVRIEDNPQLDPREKQELVSRYKKTPSLYNRFILGIWEEHITGGHFSEVYDESIHVCGRADGLPEERERLVPTPQAQMLLTGWDVGESQNHSFHIIEKIIDEDPTNRRRIVRFSVLDELVVIRTRISVRAFVEEALEKMNQWEKYQNKTNRINLRWRHWSDSSAFVYRSGANTTDAAIVAEASDGRILLDAAPKYRNSNRDKVKLLWQLLYEERIHVSAQLSVTRNMFKNLREGTSGEYVREDDHKHPFDSLSYPILAEAPIDMFKNQQAGQTVKDHVVMAGF